MSIRDELTYSLAKQVPDMARGFTIHTNYGDLVIEAGAAADRIADVVRRLLEKQRKQLEAGDE